MLSAALLLFANTLLFSLRLSGGGSFPKPLSAAEEREYLRRYAQGDQEARDVLIERNLRLVAHIIKKYYTQSGDQEDLISIGHRPHQGHHQLRPRQGRPAGHLRRPLHRK